MEHDFVWCINVNELDNHVLRWMSGTEWEPIIKTNADCSYENE